MCLPSQFSLLFCFFVLSAGCVSGVHVRVCMYVCCCTVESMYVWSYRWVIMWVFCMLNAKYTLHFHSIGVRDRIVYFCVVVLLSFVDLMHFVANETFDFSSTAYTKWIYLDLNVIILVLFIQRYFKIYFYDHWMCSSESLSWSYDCYKREWC